jgi:hypothetical protein
MRGVDWELWEKGRSGHSGWGRQPVADEIPVVVEECVCFGAAGSVVAVGVAVPPGDVGGSADVAPFVFAGAWVREWIWLVKASFLSRGEA